MSITLSRNQSLGLVTIFLIGLVLGAYNIISAVSRQEQLDELADIRIDRLFDDIESKEFGTVIDGVLIQSPSLIVLVETVEQFRLHVKYTGGVVYTTDLEPHYVWYTKEYQNSSRTLLKTYYKEYYVFNEPMTIAWKYTHEVEFTFKLEK